MPAWVATARQAKEQRVYIWRIDGLGVLVFCSGAMLTVNAMGFAGESSSCRRTWVVSFPSEPLRPVVRDKELVADDPSTLGLPDSLLPKLQSHALPDCDPF